jgi:hypothetical protein
VSDNFPVARGSFILNLSSSRDLTTLERFGAWLKLELLSR